MSSNAKVISLDNKSDIETDSVLDNFNFDQQENNSTVFPELEPKTNGSDSVELNRNGGINFKSIAIALGIIVLIAVGIWNALLLQGENETPESLQSVKPDETEKTTTSIQQPVFEVSEEPLPIVPPKNEEELALEKLMELEAGSQVEQQEKAMESNQARSNVDTASNVTLAKEKLINSADSIRLDQIESLARNGAETAHSLVPRIDLVEKQITEQDAKLVMSQRAITQTAEVVQEVKGVVNDLNQSIKAVRIELANVKDEQKSFEEQINLIEKKVISIAESGKVRTFSNGQIASTNSITANEKAQKPEPVTISASTVPTPVPANIQVNTKQDVLNNFVQITQLSVIAMTQNNAYVKDNSDRKYLLTLGKTYDQLGTVENIDTNSKTIYGRFKNGKGWMISK